MSATYIDSADEYVRLSSSEAACDRNLAIHCFMRIELWMKVCIDYPDFRFAVAHSKNVPIDVLGLLAKDSSPRVRSMVARKRKLTKELMIELLSDANPAVRTALASNKSVPNEILKLLASDCDPVVSELARKRLGNN